MSGKKVNPNLLDIFIVINTDLTEFSNLIDNYLKPTFEKNPFQLVLKCLEICTSKLILYSYLDIIKDILH